MRYIFPFLLLFPCIGLTQNKNTTKTKNKTAVRMQSPVPPLDSYIISGNIKGYADGTPVAFLNEQTGAPEPQTVIKGDKFEIKGKMDQPGFKSMVIGNAPPAVTIFLDNSRVKITGDKSSLENVVITGSPSHNLFTSYVNAIKPYERIFMPDADYDSIAVNKVSKISEDFVRRNPTSFLAPLAIIRFYQATEDGLKAEQLYNLLPDVVKNSPLSIYANQQIQESKINPLGSMIPNFSQADTTGKPVNISSLRGKFVLLDFWASWCRPCRQENPNVVAAYNKYKAKNFTVLGISLDQAKPAWVDAIKMDNLTWNHVSDLKGWSNSVAGMFHITNIPQNLLLDPSGKIIAKNLRGPRLDKKLDALLR